MILNLRTFVIFIGLIALLSCKAVNKHKLVVTDFHITFNSFVGEGVDNLKEDFVIKVISYKDMTGLIISLPRSSVKYELQSKTGEVVVSKPVYDTIKVFYFMKNQMSFALKYDSLGASKATKVNLDSLYDLIILASKTDKHLQWMEIV